MERGSDAITIGLGSKSQVTVVARVIVLPGFACYLW